MISACGRVVPSRFPVTFSGDPAVAGWSTWVVSKQHQIPKVLWAYMVRGAVDRTVLLAVGSEPNNVFALSRLLSVAGGMLRSLYNAKSRTEESALDLANSESFAEEIY